MTIKISFILLFGVSAPRCIAQITPIVSNGFTSIFQPINARDSSISKTISVYNQQIKVDVYDGYAVLGADYWFNNSSNNAITLDVGLTRTIGENVISKFYWLRIRINNGAPFTATDTSIADSDSALHLKQNTMWNTWIMSFQPGITEVSLNYGLKTGGNYLVTDGDSIERNAFEYSFSNYEWWDASDGKGEIWLRMNDGYVTKDILSLLPDKKFLAGNSIVHAFVKDVMNTSTSSISLWYRKLDREGIAPQHVNWERNVYKVNGWIVNEKIIATLSPFSATDVEGKAFQHEQQSASLLLRWSAILGSAIVVVFLLLFIYADRKKKN